MHAIATSLGREKVGALRTFHDPPAGYNTFQMERNENGVEHVECVPEITPVLKALLMLRDADDICLDAIERFAILSYDCPSSLCKVDKVKHGLFTREARSLERIPPT